MDAGDRPTWKQLRAYDRAVRRLAWAGFKAHFKSQVLVSLGVAVITAVLCWVAGLETTSAVLAVAAIVLWMGGVLTASFLWAPVQLQDASDAAARDARRTRDDAVAELAADRGGVPVKVDVSPLRSLPVWEDHLEYLLFRVSVRNLGPRRGSFTARISRLEGVAGGAEAPFDLGWRHNDHLRTASIDVDEDEVWIDIAHAVVIPKSQIEALKGEAPNAQFYFYVHLADGQPTRPAMVLGNDVTAPGVWPPGWILATLIIRDAANGQVVARKALHLGYKADGDYFMPYMTVSEPALKRGFVK